MNGLAHVVLPVANWVGDVITWPVRAVGAAIENVRELSNLRSENEELRVRLDDALRNKNACDIAIAENQKLARELDIVQSQPRGAVVADVTYDNTAFHHSTFLINRGVRHGMAVGMVVTSTDGMLVGIITDVAPGFLAASTAPPPPGVRRAWASASTSAARSPSGRADISGCPAVRGPGAPSPCFSPGRSPRLSAEIFPKC